MDKQYIISEEKLDMLIKLAFVAYEEYSIVTDEIREEFSKENLAQPSRLSR